MMLRSVDAEGCGGTSFAWHGDLDLLFHRLDMKCATTSVGLE